MQGRAHVPSLACIAVDSVWLVCFSCALYSLYKIITEF